jgi:aspartyl-tRNA(Asn)/glutamyl-tRNA(Gln) amidotransferase subunit A
MSVLTIAQAAELIAARKLSPVELAKTHLERIRRLDPQLNAFLVVTGERALADAKAAEARQMSGALRGPLDGIPIAHKDIYNTAGIRTTAHSRLLQDNVPTRDAHTVKKWADAGAVMLGKLATHEFAFGGPSFDVPWPPARNPWNRDRFTSGSSSGTGAAVAAD